VKTSKGQTIPIVLANAEIVRGDDNRPDDRFRVENNRIIGELPPNYY
jgi:hypothetical protein